MSVYVVEHKTTSSDISAGSLYWQTLCIDSQLSVYHQAATRLGYEPEGVIYDVIKKPLLRPYEINKKRAVAETPDEYGQRILESIAEDPSAYYARQKIPRSLKETRDASVEMIEYVAQMERAKQRGFYPRNPDACTAFNRQCEYFPVCSGITDIADRTYYAQSGPHTELSPEKRHLPIVSASAMKSWRRCQRHYLHSYVQGWRPIKKSFALSFGTLIHSGLEEWWKTVDLNAALAAMVTSDVVDAFELAKARALMIGYHARWCDEPLSVLAVEKEFDLPLIDPDTGEAVGNTLLAGKIDAIAEAA